VKFIPGMPKHKERSKKLKLLPPASWNYFEARN
jgi:hypothetical protein